MDYTKILLVQRQEELSQRLLIAESMVERHAIDHELEQVEAALSDLELKTK